MEIILMMCPLITHLKHAPALEFIKATVIRFTLEKFIEEPIKRVLSFRPTGRIIMDLVIPTNGRNLESQHNLSNKISHAGRNEKPFKV